MRISSSKLVQRQSVSRLSRVRGKLRTVYVPAAMCGPSRYGCGLDGSPGITEWGPCLQKTQTQVESVVCASYRDDSVELKRPALLTLPADQSKKKPVINQIVLRKRNTRK